MYHYVPIQLCGNMFELKCDDLTIEGQSLSGVCTYFRVGELDLIFDLGRCPIDFIGTNHVFISHFHLDHYFGLPIYISQRWMANISPGKIFVPADGVEQISQILDQISKLDCNSLWNNQLTPVKPNDRIEFRNNLVAYVLPLTHRVTSVGYLICEVRKKLKPEFHHLAGLEIAELKSSGVVVTHKVEIPKVVYLGDTNTIPLDSHPLLMESPILISECTFILPEDQPKAIDTMHLHIDQIAEIMPKLKSRHVVLTHFSRRYNSATIRQTIATRFSESDQERLKLII